MFSKRPDVVTARVSIAYWKKQSCQALEIQDMNRFQKCCQKLIEWEEAFAIKKAENKLKRISKPRGAPKKWTPPPQPPLQHPSAWTPSPLAWD